LQADKFVASYSKWSAKKSLLKMKSNKNKLLGLITHKEKKEEGRVCQKLVQLKRRSKRKHRAPLPKKNQKTRIYMAHSAFD